MKKITIKKLNELKNLKEKEFIINLDSLKNDEKKSAMYFLAGLTFIEGVLKKINAREFLVKIR